MSIFSPSPPPSPSRNLPFSSPSSFPPLSDHSLLKDKDISGGSEDDHETVRRASQPTSSFDFFTNDFFADVDSHTDDVTSFFTLPHDTSPERHSHHPSSHTTTSHHHPTSSHHPRHSTTNHNHHPSHSLHTLPHPSLGTPTRLNLSSMRDDTDDDVHRDGFMPSLLSLRPSSLGVDGTTDMLSVMSGGGHTHPGPDSDDDDDSHHRRLSGSHGEPHAVGASTPPPLGMDMVVSLTDQHAPPDHPESTGPSSTSSASNSRKRPAWNGPKAPPSAYGLFCTRRRPELKEANPTVKMPIISKLLAHLWKELSEEEKKPYRLAARADKVRYREALAEYADAHPDEVLPPSLAKKVKKARRASVGSPAGSHSRPRERPPRTRDRTRNRTPTRTMTSEELRAQAVQAAAVAKEDLEAKRTALCEAFLWAVELAKGTSVAVVRQAMTAPCCPIPLAPGLPSARLALGVAAPASAQRDGATPAATPSAAVGAAVADAVASSSPAAPAAAAAAAAAAPATTTTTPPTTPASPVALDGSPSTIVSPPTTT